MNRHILKPVLAGLLMGGALYFMPFFVVRVVLFVLIAGLLIRLFTRHRSGRFGHYRAMRLQYADSIRNMSDKEYALFKERISSYGCGVYKNVNTKNEKDEK